MVRLDERAIERLKGPGWDKIRAQIDRIHQALTVSPSVYGELTTIYIKYTSAETGTQPFAVMWVKKSTELVLGLALPAGINKHAAEFVDMKLKYAGLTAYLKFTPKDEVPDWLGDLAKAAYHSRLQE